MRKKGRGENLKITMKRYAKYILLILTFSVSICSISYSLETREKTTDLNAGKTRIVIHGKDLIVRMEGGIDFKHEGITLKADHGKIELSSMLQNDDLQIKSLQFEGGIKYSDKQGYKGSCNIATYDFLKREARFRGNVKIEKDDFSIKSDEIIYNTDLETFNAFGHVSYNGKTRMMALLVEKQKTENTEFSIDCENIAIDRVNGKAKAEGNVVFRSLSTKITCGTVDVDFMDDEITSLVAINGVEFIDPELNAKAEKAAYDKNDMKLILNSGSAGKTVDVVFKGQSFSGKEVIVDLSNGREITLGEGKAKISPKKNR